MTDTWGYFYNYRNPMSPAIPTPLIHPRIVFCLGFFSFCLGICIGDDPTLLRLMWGIFFVVIFLFFWRRPSFGVIFFIIGIFISGVVISHQSHLTKQSSYTTLSMLTHGFSGSYAIG